LGNCLDNARKQERAEGSGLHKGEVIKKKGSSPKRDAPPRRWGCYKVQKTEIYEGLEQVGTIEQPMGKKGGMSRGTNACERICELRTAGEHRPKQSCGGRELWGENPGIHRHTKTVEVPSKSS